LRFAAGTVPCPDLPHLIVGNSRAMVPMMDGQSITGRMLHIRTAVGEVQMIGVKARLHVASMAYIYVRGDVPSIEKP
jgi:hypothetical protein